MEKPEVVPLKEWQQAREDLLTAEKEVTRAQDALAARRRRLPMVAFSGAYTFDTPLGTRTLTDLFDGRPQLVVYQFMDRGPDHYCPGCTWLTEHVPVSGPGGVARGQGTRGAAGCLSTVPGPGPGPSRAPVALGSPTTSRCRGWRGSPRAR